ALLLPCTTLFRSPRHRRAPRELACVDSEPLVDRLAELLQRRGVRGRHALVVQELRQLSRARGCERELAEFLHDQRVPASDAATLQELSETIDERLGVDAGELARGATMARRSEEGRAG